MIGAVCGILPHAALAQSADPLEGRIVTEIRVTGLRHLSSDAVERHLATKVGEPFRQATVALDQRRLDALRLFMISANGWARMDQLNTTSLKSTRFCWES